MKRTMISLIIASIVIMPGCYDPGKNATVKINLGNIPVAKHVEKKTFLDKVFSLFVKDAYASYASTDMGISFIHIAALSGDTVIASVSIDATSPDIVTNGGTDIIELEVPAGSDRRIVVLGESGNLITWYGVTDRAYEFAAGDEVDVPVIMYDISNYSNFVSVFNLHNNTSLNREEWDKIAGASGYNIYNAAGGFLTTTENNFFPFTFGYNLEVDFSFAGKFSDRIIFAS